MPSLTITTTAEQASRLASAYGAKLGLGRDATQAEVKAALIAEMKSVVRSYEAERAHRSVVIPADIEPA